MIFFIFLSYFLIKNKRSPPDNGGLFALLDEFTVNILFPYTQPARGAARPQVAGGEQLGLQHGDGGAGAQHSVRFRLAACSVSPAVRGQVLYLFAAGGRTCSLVNAPHRRGGVCTRLNGGRLRACLTVVHIVFRIHRLAAFGVGEQPNATNIGSKGGRLHIHLPGVLDLCVLPPICSQCEFSVVPVRVEND